MADNISTESIENATGRSLADWIAELDAAGGRDLSHAEIARYLESKFTLPPTWTQWVTIAYERAIGRRVIGQNCDGEWVARGTKTLSCPDGLDGAMAVWLNYLAGRTELNGIALNGTGRVSYSEKWRYWRADLADGSKIALNISLKPDGKAAIGLEQRPINTKEEMEEWKAFWKQFMAGLKA